MSRRSSIYRLRGRAVDQGHDHRPRGDRSRRRSRCGPANGGSRCSASPPASRSPAGSSPAPRPSLPCLRRGGKRHIAAMLIHTEQTPNPGDAQVPARADRDRSRHARFRRCRERRSLAAGAGAVRQRDGRRRLLRPRLHLGHRGARRLVDRSRSARRSKPCSTISSAARRLFAPGRAAGIEVAGDATSTKTRPMPTSSTRSRS